MTAPSQARLLTAQRHQIELRSFDLDASLPADHPARSAWAFVQKLDLGALYAQIKSVRGGAGAPAIDPAILMALWLWATIDGVGSAREVQRLCGRDDAYRWLCGGVNVNHHTLADFRVAHGPWLDMQLTLSMASLLDRRLITLEVVAQDGLRVRASAKASSFRRKDRLLLLQATARQQVQALKAELDGDASASVQRKHERLARSALDREQRLTQALHTLERIERRSHKLTQSKADRRRGASSSLPSTSSPESSDPTPTPTPTPSPHTTPVAPAIGEGSAQRSDGAETLNKTGKIDTATAPSKAGKPAAQPRASTSDPQARIMKMADGGFRPAYNVQLVVDEKTQLIAALEVSDQGSDMNEMVPLHAQLVRRYDHTPALWLADGGYPKHTAIEHLSRCGTQPVIPPAKSRKKDFNPLAPQSTDSDELARWRGLMASDEGKALYKRRSASIECTNAQLRRRRLDHFNVRGRLKARAVVIWHALAHNLMRMRSLGLAI